MARIRRPAQKRFNSFKEYAFQFERIAVETPIAERRFLELVGEIVEKTAKSKFGHYQLAVGPFPEWEQLKESTKADRLRKNFSENDPLYRTGKLRDSISHKVHMGAVKSVEIGSPDPVMLWQELGVKQNNLPPRPVLGPAMYANRQVIATLAGEMMFGLMTYQIGKIKK